MKFRWSQTTPHRHDGRFQFQMNNEFLLIIRSPFAIIIIMEIGKFFQSDFLALAFSTKELCKSCFFWKTGNGKNSSYLPQNKRLCSKIMYLTYFFFSLPLLNYLKFYRNVIYKVKQVFLPSEIYSRFIGEPRQGWRYK